MRNSSLTRWLRRHSLVLVAAGGAMVGVAYAATRHPAPTVHEVAKPQATKTIQIALLLDTSSSMDGLINQARAELWKMVEQLGKLQNDGKPVRVELALYEYGNDMIPESAGYIRRITPFTTDLDTVSEQLHSLVTNGGSEFVPSAIEQAVTTLDWSRDPNTMKLVVVAGNEEFEQGPLKGSRALADAAAKGIHVQLIYCGGKDETWSAASKVAKSDLLSIDQDHVARYIPAPQDDEITALGQKLNDTYIAYGTNGVASMERQQTADAQSGLAGKNYQIERMQLKSTANYSNESWDVVDAMNMDARFLENTKDEQLPADLRGKTLAEKKAIVEAHKAERAKIQARIAELESQRSKFLATQNTETETSLGTELVKATKQFAQEMK